jgi:hypothetical protein
MTEHKFCLYHFAGLSPAEQAEKVAELAEDMLQDREAGREVDLVKYFHLRSMLAVRVTREMHQRPHQLAAMRRGTFLDDSRASVNSGTRAAGP